MQTIRINLNESTLAIVSIPGSTGSEVYPYTIKKASDGSTFKSGNMTFIVGDNWKTSFTAIEGGTYLLRIPHLTIEDKNYGNNYLAEAVVTPVPVVPTPTDENEALLAAYKAARLAILAGGQSYKIKTGGTEREVNRASLPQINKEIQRLEALLGLTAQASILIPGF